MVICKVIGHVWATKKDEALNGLKLMVVKQTQTSQRNPPVFVAADVVGAGIGEMVLVVNGSTARRATGGDNLPVDSAIVGIIDSLEIQSSKPKEG